MKRTNNNRWALALLLVAGMSLTMNGRGQEAGEPPLPPRAEPDENGRHLRIGHADKLSNFDLNEDGDITADEFVAAGEAMALEQQSNFLARFDSAPEGQEAGDGIITSDESEGLHEARAESWLEGVLEALDTNGDGSISEDDDLPRRGRRGPHRLWGLDADEDGIISGAELVAAAENMAAGMQKHFLERYDSVPEGETDGDGVITAEESLAVHENHVVQRIEAVVERYDLNEDGNVTGEEIEEVHEARFQNRRSPRFGRKR